MKLDNVKIALCFSGQIRTGILTYNNIKNFIGELMPQCDVFVHTWDVITQTSSDLSIAGVPFKEKNELFENFSKLWNPKKMVVETFDDWKRINQIEPLFYSLLESNKLRKNYELDMNIKYDFVIKIRPDFIYNPNYKLKDEMEVILNAEYGHTIYTLDFGNCISLKKFEDVFWIAKSHVFDKAVDYYYERLNTYECDWQTEMADYLTKNNIEYKRLFCGNEGIPYRWSNLYDGGRTVEDYEMNWRRYFYNLPYQII
jgi:hypothetical protein